MHLTILRDLMMKLRKNIAILTLSTILVSASVFYPKEVRNEADFKNVQLGLPLPFVVQNLNRYRFLLKNERGILTKSGAVPLHLYSLLENPARFIAWAYLVDIVIVFGGFSLLEFLIQRISRQNSSASQ